MARKAKQTELVQIQKSPIPPLHQSTETMTSCVLFYIESVIKRRKKPGGMESARGKQVHKVHSDYASWCANKGVEMDLDAFDQFAKGVGPMASKILVGMRDSYKVDHSHLLATELTLALDENFQPTDIPDAVAGGVADSGLPPHFQGTLDTLYLFREECKALIDDSKTHPKPFEPSDPDKALQGKMYSLFVLLHLSWIQEVTFRLVFVRFKNLTRFVTYKREDIPSLIESVKAARERQKMIHVNYDNKVEMEPTPGDHCFYCNLLSERSCPIGQLNENMQLTDEERLRFKIWDSVFGRINTKVLSAKVNATGRDVVVRDYNGKAYKFGPEPLESQVLPLFQATSDGIVIDKEGNPSMPIVSLLMDYAHATPDDTEWLAKATISSSSISSYLKAKSRAFVHQAISDTAEKVTKVKMKVSKPLDAVPDEEPEDEDGEWSDDGEEF